MLFTQENLRRSLAGLGITPGEDIFKQLRRAYAEGGRHYHTDKHVSECLAHFQNFRHLGNRPAEIEIALWFHDAIYDTHRSDNEEKSAEWAQIYLASEGADAEAVDRIVEMIHATKTHHARLGDAALMLDVDLGILGASRSAFEAYDHAIRLEYGWVPEEQYRHRRAQVLKTFLDRESIYKTREFRDQYEGQARENLARKFQELSA